MHKLIAVNSRTWPAARRMIDVVMISLLMLIMMVKWTAIWSAGCAAAVCRALKAREARLLME